MPNPPLKRAEPAMAPFDGSAAWSAASAQPQRFKEALAHLASGVAIISCWDDATPRGLLVSSITGLSADPPRFLFCVRKEAASHDALIAAETCAIAILSAQDKEEAWRFSSSARSLERFAPSRWTLNPQRPPAYLGGLSRALCRIDSRIDAQTHSILIVTALELDLELGAAPLVACARDLHDLKIRAEPATPQAT